MTKEKRLLNYLNEHGSITSLQAINELGDTRLSATIFNLKKMGYNVVDSWVVANNRYGEKTHFKAYSILGDAPDSKSNTLF